MPDSMPFSISILYILFAGFLDTHRRHATDFRGASNTYLLLLNLSTFIGSIVGILLLIYYGYQTVWYLPFILMIVSYIVGGIIFGILEGKLNVVIMSLTSFIGWPICAFFFFYFVNHLSIK